MLNAGRELLSIDPEFVILKLKSFLADEWIAYYQYWISSKAIKGPMSESVIKELEEHSKDELDHASKISQRIIQLGGNPLLSPQQILQICNCPYIEIDNVSVINLLDINIKAEQCAIENYYKFLHEIRKSDIVTCMVIKDILKDEVEHESDLSSLLDNFNTKYLFHMNKKLESYLV